MGRILWSGRKADLEAYKGTYDVSRHRYINLFPCIIPLQGHAEVEGTDSVDGGGILGVQRVVDVVKVGAGSGTDAEVVNWITHMVLVQVGMRVLTPCASRPILVTLENVQSAPSLPVRRAPISHFWPVAGSSTAPAKRSGSGVAGIVGKMGCAARCQTAYIKLVDCHGGGSLMLVVTGSCYSQGRRVGGRILVDGD